MNKFFTLSLSLLLGAPLFAESIQTFKCSPDGIPGQTEPMLMGFGISADGNYICGSIQQGAGFFIADRISGQVKYRMEDYGGELRGVDCNGVGIGYAGDGGVLFYFDNEEVDYLTAPAGGKFLLGEGLSNNGALKIGSLTDSSYKTQAAYKEGAADWKILPTPSDSELGGLKNYLSNMSAAKSVSGDGKVILGYLGSFTLPVLWIKNDAGEYVPDFFPARFVKDGSSEDMADESKPLYGLSGMYTCLSNNGKYVGLVGMIPEDDGMANRAVAVVYDTEENTIKIYSDPQDVDPYGVGLYPRAIADDGTFIGAVGPTGDPGGTFGTFIMLPGQEQAESYLDAFPAYNEMFGEAELYGLNIPTGISADGNYILGYTFYSEDFDMSSDAPAYYLTYVITRDSAGVDQMESSVKPGTEEIYSLDGRKLNSLGKGVNVIRTPDGSVRKIIR